MTSKFDLILPWHVFDMYMGILEFGENIKYKKICKKKLSKYFPKNFSAVLFQS
jgi:hypothetical protein